MFDLYESFEELTRKIGGVKAALIVDNNAIEVATWGEADFETASAELVEIWKQAGASDVCLVSGRMRSLQISGSEGGWTVVPLGDEYMLAILVDAGIVLGKAKFYASEWVLANREEFC